MPVVAVAYSGGRDSTALLHVTARMASVLGMRVLALHVHHGLSAFADAWEQHSAAQCMRWRQRGLPVEFMSARLATSPGRGESVEGWARRERYGALRRMATEQGAHLVLLAHHRRDQAETFLLQALRAGSSAALSSMPSSATRDGVTWARPWLGTPGTAIAAYVRSHRLSHIEDDSNADVRMARNRLRAQVWPALIAAFPDAEAALSAAATLAQAAATTMQEWATTDVASVVSADGLRLAAWCTLPPGRRANALHSWLRLELGADAMSRSLVDRLSLELDPEKVGRWPVGDVSLRSYRGVLRLDRSNRKPRDLAASAPPDEAVPSAIRIDLSTPGAHAVPPWQGRFIVERVDAGGLSPAIAEALELRSRRPGDRFQAGGGRPPRSLKLQFQAAAVPAWRRGGPVLAHGDTVVYVPGLGIDARAVDTSGRPALRITWSAD